MSYIPTPLSILSEGIVTISPDSQGSRVHLSITPREAEHIFYKLWNEFGDEWIGKMIEAEGYSPIKKIQSP